MPAAVPFLPRVAAALLALAAMAGAASAGSAAPACGPLRFAYNDNEIFPYLLGSGDAVRDPPGSAVEFMRRAFESQQCPHEFSRLPTNRVRAEAIVGNVTAVFVMEADAAIQARLAFPTAADRQLDSRRSLLVPIYLYVRREEARQYAEGLPAGARRLLGVPLGAYYQRGLRKLGWRVEETARDVVANLKKLQAHRLDGVASIGPGMDRYLQAHPELEVVRVEQPVMMATLYVAFNQAYYEANRERVEGIWNWIGLRGQRQFDELNLRYLRMAGDGSLAEPRR